MTAWCGTFADQVCWVRGIGNALNRPGDLEEGYSFQSDQNENSSGVGCGRKTQKPAGDTQRSSAATWRVLFSTKLSSSCWIWASLSHWQCPYGWEQSTPVFLPGGFHGQMEPGRLQSMGSQRVGHEWVIKHKAFYYCSNSLMKIIIRF